MGVNSVPLSLTIFCSPRLAISVSSSRETHSPDSEISATTGQAFACAVIDNPQHPEAPTIGHLVGNEVLDQRSFGAMGISIGALVPWRACGHLDVAPSDYPRGRSGTGACDWPGTLSAQQDVPPPIAEPSPLVGNRLYPIAKYDVISSKRLVAYFSGVTALNADSVLARDPLSQLDA